MNRHEIDLAIEQIEHVWQRGQLNVDQKQFFEAFHVWWRADQEFAVLLRYDLSLEQRHNYLSKAGLLLALIHELGAYSYALEVMQRLEPIFRGVMVEQPYIQRMLTTTFFVKTLELYVAIFESVGEERAAEHYREQIKILTERRSTGNVEMDHESSFHIAGQMWNELDPSESQKVIGSGMKQRFSMACELYLKNRVVEAIGHMCFIASFIDEMEDPDESLFELYFIASLTGIVMAEVNNVPLPINLTDLKLFNLIKQIQNQPAELSVVNFHWKFLDLFHDLLTMPNADLSARELVLQVFRWTLEQVAAVSFGDSTPVMMEFYYGLPMVFAQGGLEAVVEICQKIIVQPIMRQNFQFDPTNESDAEKLDRFMDGEYPEGAMNMARHFQSLFSTTESAPAIAIHPLEKLENDLLDLERHHHEAVTWSEKKRRARQLQGQFDDWIRRTLQNDDPITALVVCERSKNRSLSDLIWQSGFSIETIDQHVTRRLYHHRVRSFHLHELINFESDSTKRLEMQRELIKCSSLAREMEQAILEQYPEYTFTAAAVTPHEIEELAREHVLVELRVLEEMTLVFSVFDDLVQCVACPLTAQQANQIAADWQELQPLQPSELEDRLNLLLTALGDALQPLFEIMMRAEKPVLMIPHGPLSTLPLHAIFDHIGECYLSDLGDIKFAPSLSAFYYLEKRHQHHSNHNNFSTLIVSYGGETDSANELLYVSEEVAAIQEICVLSNVVGSTWGLTDEEHTSNLQYLHVACHGVFQPSAPLSNSYLLLKDRKLTLGELTERLTCRGLSLASLSACQTGSVNFEEVGDEHYGIGYGFLLAGAATVWSSLWSVSDHATYLLMKQAYQYLELGESKSASLQLAQRWLRKEYPRYQHPLYWAGFQSIGV
jgi:CHAT domain-containing protein